MIIWKFCFILFASFNGFLLFTTLKGYMIDLYIKVKWVFELLLLEMELKFNFENNSYNMNFKLEC